MFSRIRRHVSYANVIVVIALVLAMTGGAYAAKKYVITSTSQIKPSVLKSLQGKAGLAGAAGSAGAPGAQGPQGPVGANGSNGTNGTNGTNGPAGATGPTGKPGTPGLPGSPGPTGPAGVTGAAGATGPEGVCSTASCVLPSGATETGTWTLNAINLPESGVELTAAISFPIRLKEGSKEPEEHAFYFNKAETKEIEEGNTVGTSGCKIENKATPVAPKGELCVYTEEEHLEAMAFHTIRPATSSELSPQYGTVGAFVFFKATGEPASVRTRGTWAVTAP
jgi:hypothetical protein